MWRRWWSSGGALKQSVSAVFGEVHGRKLKPQYASHVLGLRAIVPASSLWLRASSSSSSSSASSACADSGPENGDCSRISFMEAKKLMRLVNVEALKKRLGMDGKEVIGYSELLEACESMGVARSPEEAAAFARVLDEAGVVLLFRDKVYLHPDKVVREHDPLGRDVEVFRQHLYAAGKEGPTVKGSMGAELVDGLVIKEGDYKLVKTRFSAFFATHLHSFLQGAGITNLVITGVQTPNCIRQTVFDAVALDYQPVTVIVDATAAATPDIHTANIFDMKNVGVATPTLQEWCESDA